MAPVSGFSFAGAVRTWVTLNIDRGYVLVSFEVVVARQNQPCFAFERWSEERAKSGHRPKVLPMSWPHQIPKHEKRDTRNEKRGTGASSSIQRPIAESVLGLHHFVNLGRALVNDGRPGIPEIAANRRLVIREPFVAMDL